MQLLQSWLLALSVDASQSAISLGANNFMKNFDPSFQSNNFDLVHVGGLLHSLQLLCMARQEEAAAEPDLDLAPLPAARPGLSAPSICLRSC